VVRAGRVDAMLIRDHLPELEMVIKHSYYKSILCGNRVLCVALQIGCTLCAKHIHIDKNNCCTTVE